VVDRKGGVVAVLSRESKAQEICDLLNEKENDGC
jgi:hypothetical protein